MRLCLAMVLLVSCSPSACLADGQLFCATVTPAGPIIVAVADAAGVPIIATGLASATVTAICAQIAAIPVSPPANAAIVPMVAVALPKNIKGAT